MYVLKWIGYALFAVVCTLVVVVVVGAFLPEEHIASATADVAAPQDRVWALIADVNAQQRWRKDLRSISGVHIENGRTCWTEVQKHIRMPMCEDVSAPPKTRVVRIADASLPFAGSWTYQLESTSPTVTRVTITENGTTGPALWRFLRHFVLREGSSIRQYEADLQKAAAS